MSNQQEIKLSRANRIFALFLFVFGLAVAMACLVLAVELLLANSPENFQQYINDFKVRYQALGVQPKLFDVALLKVQMYQAILAIEWVLWAIPITILSLTLAFIMGLTRRAIVGSLLERLQQQRHVLVQERKRKKDALIQLEKSEDHLNHIHEQLTEAFLVINKDERFKHANRVGVQLLSQWNRTPKSARHYLEQPVEAFIPDYHASGLGLCVADAISKGLSWQKELYLEKNNTWLQVRVYPAGGDSAYVYMRDISNEKKPGHFKRLGEDMIISLSETSPHAMAILDRQWNYLVVSKKWKEAFHLLDENIVGKSHKALMPRLPGKWQALEGQLLEGKVVKSAGMPFHLNGRDELISWEISPWKVGEKIQGFMMYADIITDIHHNKEKLEQQREREHKLAYHDILTGLPNRQLFYDRLTMALAHAYRNLGKVALFFLDLDGFKGINDSLGHDIGDMLLKEVATRLKGCVRDTDTVARLGGDEFTIILNGVSSEEDAHHVAEKVIKRINEVFKLGEHDVYVSTSIGISLYPLDGSTSADLIKKADTAMYWSKEGGKNQANFFTKSLNAGGVAEVVDIASSEKSADKVSSRELESHIRTALQKEEVEVYFQPIYNQRRKAIAGLEALIRWNHPTAGLLEPRKFLNIAENTGMILPIGEHVLEEVTLKAESWRQMSKEPLTFGINLSRRQLKDENLPKRIIRVLGLKKIPLEWLVLEVPEAVLVDTDDEITANLKLLADSGCRLYVDDFGVKCKSFQQLEGLPIQGIKIHESIARQSMNSVEDKTIMTSMVKLANGLGIDIVAKGVETEELASFLLSLGVENIQGFVVSKPTKPEKIADLLK